jgi:TRIAD3 protein (E3 ubiquitin-protein ligase RNF216)
MPPHPEVIDLTLDSDDEAAAPVADAVADRDVQLEVPAEEQRDAPEGLDPLDPLEIFDDYYHVPGQFNDPPLPAMGDLRDVPLVIDDFGNLEEEPQQQAGADQEDLDAQIARNLEDDQQHILTKDDCLARVYEMFPDVCPEHALTLYDQVATDAEFELSPAIRLDRVIEKLITDGPYPKRKKDTQHLKRKRRDSIDDEYKRWEGDDRAVMPRFLAGSIRSILKAEFPTFTHASINEVVAEEKYLFKSYIRLASLRDTDVNPRRGRPSVAANADTIIANSGWPPLGEELTAARKRAQEDCKKREDERIRKRVEEENRRRAMKDGRTAECQACFDDLPMNRQVHCHGDEPHFTCFSCIETYIKSEIGDSRCRVLCTAGCGAGFEPAQLNLISDKQLLQKLADLQQEKDIREANLDDLEECPFCDYKAIMPPIEENFEFHCANPECEKVSCRRCKASSHIPISCEEFAKEKKANSRHTIEEAMTAALIRSCNRCKKQFIKEFGCNKMTCPSCRNLQCYVCSETLKGYDHFDQTPQGDPRPGGKCPLYDNLEERHEREVKAAEEAARAQVIANNPDVAPEDLEIKVSDAVKKSTEQRIRRAGPEGLGGGPQGWGAHAAFLPVVWAGFDGRNNDDDDGDDDGGLPLGLRGQIRRRAPPRPAVAQRANGLNDERPEPANNVAARLRRARQFAEIHRMRLDHAQQRLRAQQDIQENENARLVRDLLNVGRAQVAQVQQAALARPAAVNGGPLLAPPALPQQQLLQAPQGNAYNHFLVDPVAWPAPQFPGFLEAQQILQQQPQPMMAQPPAAPMNNVQQQQPFQRGPVPDGFAVPLMNNAPAFPDYLQIARDNVIAPAANPVFDLRDDVPQAADPPHLANVARNMHQLEMMRQQHDARQAEARLARFRELAERRRNQQ